MAQTKESHRYHMAAWEYVAATSIALLVGAERFMLLMLQHAPFINDRQRTEIKKMRDMGVRGVRDAFSVIIGRK